jgi:hypothetical protein
MKNERFWLSWYEKEDPRRSYFIHGCTDVSWKSILTDQDERLLVFSVVMEAEDSYKAQDAIVKQRGLVSWRAVRSIPDDWWHPEPLQK